MRKLPRPPGRRYQKPRPASEGGKPKGFLDGPVRDRSKNSINPTLLRKPRRGEEDPDTSMIMRRIKPKRKA